MRHGRLPGAVANRVQRDVDTIKHVNCLHVIMKQIERRELIFEALTVEQGVQLARMDGVGPAMDYMLHHGISPSVAIRVLTSPQWHRQNFIVYEAVPRG